MTTCSASSPEQSLGFVATVCPDGTANVSPKGTLTVWDDEHLVFLHVHSPGTVTNLAANPSVEVNVVDPLVRKGYRFKGEAEVLTDGDRPRRRARPLPARAGHRPARGAGGRPGAGRHGGGRSCRRPTTPAPSEASIVRRWRDHHLGLARGPARRGRRRRARVPRRRRRRMAGCDDGRPGRVRRVRAVPRERGGVRAPLRRAARRPPRRGRGGTGPPPRARSCGATPHRSWCCCTAAPRTPTPGTPSPWRWGARWWRSTSPATATPTRPRRAASTCARNAADVAVASPGASLPRRAAWSACRSAG